MTPQGWVTKPPRGGSRDAPGVGHVTPRGVSGDTSMLGPVTRGSPVVGSLSAHARPTYKPERSQPRLGEKPPPVGLPMFLHFPGRAPLRMEEKGIFAVVGSGQRSLGVCLHVCQVPAHRTQVFQPRGGRRLLIAGCKCPAGSRKGMGTPGHTGHRVLREFHGKSPAQAPGIQVCP